ncbi:Response regulator c-di-GMP phosphodiesterase, RpfG family, contains REC and HD-GYP domains [Maridesulfovibrio ferrireducens]|uniref:Response regulator c-di-GMP phosphodiesterase, RpfG family, contains REC and HD-GYP domains n=1 Tax=Maridesulfovibrio ferrireducens TaxID=246191 RepID=A0A1G9FTI7_9BACT|nr:HD domain-containing phosphohydrolase [Maridesulfovibrio ferrireducens]SDK91690.1 Response regulator c-di-GMP phosphodiesterase, RpfG family, contains REC and HD-GYP domains [Maridesulfovibrio ferrireducens]
MKSRILLVDDEPNVLSALKRQLRGVYDVETEEDPTMALLSLNNKKPFAAVVSDYRMPKMNGIEFLREVRKRSPETTRIMLTGYADLDNAIRAVNDGHVFRFLTKPCENEVLLENLKEAVSQYDLVTGKRILLEKTLKGSVELLGEITSLIKPESGARINRVRRYVRYLAKKKGVKDFWRYDIATMLSQLGTLILPPGTLDVLLEGKKLNPEQLQMFEMHPVIAKSLVAKLPRLEAIAEMIAYQLKGFDGSGTPRDAVKGEKIPLGGRILKVALDYDLHLQNVENPKKAFDKLEKVAEVYDPELLYYLEGMLGVEARYIIKEVGLKHLYSGMILYEDVTSKQGAMLLRKSLELDKDKIDRIHMFDEKIGIKLPLLVLVSE